MTDLIGKTIYVEVSGSDDEPFFYATIRAVFEHSYHVAVLGMRNANAFWQGESLFSGRIVDVSLLHTVMRITP